MTEPVNPDLMALATPYALHALTDSERAELDHRLAAAPPDIAEAFDAEVRAVRETMAVMSSATAVEPPAPLRERLLAAVGDDSVRELPTKRPTRWRTTILAAAAVLAIGLGALGVGIAMRPQAPTSTADQVFAAKDVQTVSGALPGGGTATLVFSHQKDAGVLVMNNVPPPQPDTVYQMWLIGDNGPQSAGVMDAKAVGPSTTAVLPDLGDSKSLAFTVEPPGGSAAPTSQPFAELRLT